MCVCVCSKNWQVVASNQIFWIWRSSQCFWFWVLELVLLQSSIQPVNLMLVAFCCRSKRCHNWSVCGLSLEVRTLVQWGLSSLHGIRLVHYCRSFWTQLRRAWWKRKSPVLYINSPSVKEHKKKQVLVERNPSSLNFVAHLWGMHLLEVLLASGVTMLAVTFFKVQRSFMLMFTCQCHVR